MSEVVAVIIPSTMRRSVGVVVICALGLFLIYLSVKNATDSFRAQVFLMVLGLVALGLADALRRATAMGLELTRDELRDTSGRVLARMDDIVSVDRGAFASKPSVGFAVHLRGTARPLPGRRGCGGGSGAGWAWAG